MEERFFNLQDSDYLAFNNIDDIIKLLKENNTVNLYIIDQFGKDNDGQIPDFKMNILSNLYSERANIKIKFFSNDVSFYNNGSANYICSDLYNQHKEKINEVLYENMCNLKDSSITLQDPNLYDENLLNILIDNGNSIFFKHKPKLSEDIKKKLKENWVACSYTENNKKVEISTNIIFKYHNPKEVMKEDCKQIDIPYDITDYENLKLIKPNTKIIIGNLSVNKYDCMDYYEKVEKIIKTLRDNFQNNIVEFNCMDRRLIESSKLYRSGDKNIIISGFDTLEKYTLDEAKEELYLINQITDDIKSMDLSPFEQYLAAFNITKKFKEYRENIENKDESRVLRKFLNNDYMVCVGYAKLLNILLTNLGISSYDYSVGTDVSYDKGFSIEEKSVDLVGHARLIVNIKDDKYDIDGIFVADPTWDNNLEKDYYNHALIPFNKTSEENRYFKLSNEDLILNSDSIEEYYDKVNIIFQKNIDRNSAYLKKPDYDEKIICDARRQVTHIILDLLEQLDVNLYFKVKEKYDKRDMTKEDFKKFIDESGHYFIGKVQKDFDLKTTIEAASNLNAKVFNLNEKQKEEYESSLYESNLKKDKKSFPYYYEKESFGLK